MSGKKSPAESCLPLRSPSATGREAWPDPRLLRVPEQSHFPKAVSSPTVPQLSIRPVPEEIEEHLRSSPTRIREWLPHAKADAHVLSPAYGDLHLRQNIPVRASARLEVPHGQKLHHRRKQPSQHMVRRHRLPYSHPPEHAARSYARIHRQVRPQLGLQKRVLLEQLIECCEGLELRRPRTEPSLAVPGRQQNTALQTQDRTRPQTGKHLPLQRQRNVPKTRRPVVRLVRIVHRNIGFKLGPGVDDRSFINDIRSPRRRPRRTRGRRNHNLVLWKRLLRYQCPWQIQLAQRIVVDIFAESPHVRDHIVDLLVRQQIPKRRHNLREPTRWPAVNDHCLPITVWLRRRPGAVRKVRKRIWPLENRTRHGSTLALAPVTGSAAAVVNLLSIVHIRSFRITERLCGKKQRPTKKHDKA